MVSPLPISNNWTILGPADGTQGEAFYDEIALWAEDEFRSMNGQIEYLLTECVKWRKRSGKKDE